MVIEIKEINIDVKLFLDVGIGILDIFLYCNLLNDVYGGWVLILVYKLINVSLEDFVKRVDMVINFLFLDV